jgi:hypothetical protein
MTVISPLGIVARIISPDTTDFGRIKKKWVISIKIIDARESMKKNRSCGLIADSI